MSDARESIIRQVPYHQAKAYVVCSLKQRWGTILCLRMSFLFAGIPTERSTLRRLRYSKIP